MVRLYIILLLIGFACANAVQAQDCFATITLNKRSVYVQQPFRITIRVLTKTWYTAPLDFDNIQIPNAFVIPFDRTQSGMFPGPNNTQLAGLEFYYIVFPYKPGTFTIPPIHIVAETPPEGSATSRKVTIATRPQSIVVRDVPESMKGESWFVAKGVRMSEHWNKSLKNLKVGDVVERTITIDAQGTLPQFIPDVAKEKPGWASIYPDDAELKDTRDDNDANGEKVETMTYLLEEAGDFKVPPVKLRWWNPNNSRMYEQSTAATGIHIAPNPNLGILTTLKDSLQSQQKIAPPPEKKKGPYLIYGIPWYWFTLYALLALVVLYIVIRLAISLVNTISQKRRAYLAGETHWFNRFMHAPNDVSKLMAGMYSWWDRSGIEHASASAAETFRDDKEPGIAKDMDAYYTVLYKAGNKTQQLPDEKAFKQAIKKYRHRKRYALFKNEEKTIAPEQRVWEP